MDVENSNNKKKKNRNNQINELVIQRNIFIGIIMIMTLTMVGFLIYVFVINNIKY